MKKTLLFIALIASSAFFAQTNLVLNGACEEHTGDVNDNADSWDMTPPSTLKSNDAVPVDIDSPYNALWSNSTLDAWLNDAFNDDSEQPGSTSDGSYVNGEKTRGVKLSEASRRLYQKIVVVPGTEYTFKIDSRSEAAQNVNLEVINSEVFILNTEIENETGLSETSDSVDAYFKITNDFSEDKKVFTTTEFTFTATTNTVVIYVRSLATMDNASEVFYDNIWLYATNDEGDEGGEDEGGVEGDELVLNGTGDENVESENAGAFDMTPNSDIDDGSGNDIASPYRALWYNDTLDGWLNDNCGDSDEQPGSTSDGQLNESFEKTRAFKLYETCRRLYQKIAVTPGTTYNFSVETRAEKGEEDDDNVIEVNNLEVYILNTEIEDENGLTGAVGGVVDHYVNIVDHLNNSKPSEGNNTFVKTEFSFTATTNTVVIYMKAPLATSSAYDVYVDNVSLKAAAVASVDNVFADNITIYPNPATNFIKISTTENISNVEVYNIVGKRVLSIKKLENNQVDISNLASGMYMLRLTNGTSVTTKKIMKQ